MMKAPMIGLIALAMSLPAAVAQPTGSPPAPPNVIQWQDIAEPMATLIAAGYSISTATDMIGSNKLDITSTFYLAREKDVIRCSEGFRPGIGRAWVMRCQRLVAPFVMQ
jgi:hypothetical protein